MSMIPRLNGDFEWNIRPSFDALAEPTFHQGGRIGCIVQHGIGGTPANMRLIADKLEAAGYTVIVPLLPGHGETVRDQRRCTDADWYRSVLEAYDKLKESGCTEIVPIGLSLGGILMSLVAANRPCRALVVIAPPIRMRCWLHAVRLLHPIVPYMGYTKAMKNHTLRDLPYSQMYNCSSPHALQMLQRLIRRLRGELGNITCPTYAIWAGRDDKVHPSSSRLFRKGVIHAPLTEQFLPDAIHGCTYYVHSRDEVADLVCDYVSKAAPLPND